MIYIQTTAYNASKTLRRAVESILNQTYGDFQLYLTDNGSIDNGKTREIVVEYAKLDSRVKPFFNKKNHVWDENKKVLSLPHYIDGEDYYCCLDADDEYAITFLSDMLKFIEQNSLDIAACGSDFIQESNGQLLGQRLSPQDLILYGNRFADLFPECHQFMRTIWGKLFKGKTLRNTIIDINSPEIPKVYGNDTFFTTRAFRDAKRVGILSKSLHKYYMSPKSTSYVFNPDRSRCDRILRKAALEFLAPYGDISPRNKEFLNCVHANATKDTLIVILNSNISVLKKMKWLKELFSDEGITGLVLSQNEQVKNIVNEIRNGTLNWLVSQTECRTLKGAKTAADIIESLSSKCDTFNYLRKIQKRRPDFITALKKCKWVEQHLLRDSLVENISAELAFAIPDVIKCILNQNYAAAWEAFIVYDEIEISEKDEESYYILGQNLAALAEDAAAYVYLKKVWLSYLIDHKRKSEAEDELNEFIRIFPDDEAFQQMKNKF